MRCLPGEAGPDAPVRKAARLAPGYLTEAAPGQTAHGDRPRRIEPAKGRNEGDRLRVP